MATYKKYAFIGVIAFSFVYVHYKYVSNIFENVNHFSHLSDLEREMVLRTEMGFYYSYYKTIVEEQPFVAGISKLMYDKLVEYPKEVNAFNRFNIHPEVIIGTVYRYLEPMLNDSSKRDCHIVDRGEDNSMVESCTDIGQPMIFYLEAVWWLAGLTVGALFLHAVSLSGSIVGGIISIVHYFANHTECTRVQWAPNERENMAMPFLLLQSWLLTLQLRDKNRRPVLALQISIFILNCICLLFWQFTQFIFLTQMAIYFFMEQIRIIDVKVLSVFLHSHFCGLHMAVLLLQGNDMLKTSLYTSFFLVVSIYCLFFSSLRIKVQNRWDLFLETCLIVTRIAIVLCISLGVKKLLSDFFAVQEDSHIWEMLFSKFTSYKTFHTLIYTCMDVFDFLPWASIRSMMSSFLIPIAVFNTCYFINSVLVQAVQRSVRRKTRPGQPSFEQPTRETRLEPSNNEQTNAEPKGPEPPSPEESKSEITKPKRKNAKTNETEPLRPDDRSPESQKTDLKRDQNSEPPKSELTTQQAKYKQSNCHKTNEETKPVSTQSDDKSSNAKGDNEKMPGNEGSEITRPESKMPAELRHNSTESEEIMSDLTESKETRPEVIQSEETKHRRSASDKIMPKQTGSEVTRPEPEGLTEIRPEVKGPTEQIPDLTGSKVKGPKETRPKQTEPESSRSNSTEVDDSGIESNAESQSNTKTTLNSTDVPAKDAEKHIPKDPFVEFIECFTFDPAIFYNISQMIAFAIMAGLVMRLKLLFTTQMCLIASLLTRKSNFFLPNIYKKYLPLIWVIFVVLTLRSLLRNVQREYYHVGEFSNYPQEQLLQWITHQASSGAFAGSMPILASVMLSTRKPIVLHPHYEHLETRQRAYAVYKVYGRFKSDELYQELNKLEASYLIVESEYCYGRSNKGCTFGDIWDVEEPSLSHRPLLCHTLLTEPVEHFYPVFRNSVYAVFRVHDVSVRYMPRSFDT